MLMYDRTQSRTAPASTNPQDIVSTTASTPPAVGGESLWSQLKMKAITGTDSAKNLVLRPLHYDLVTWEFWSRTHPDTLVINRDMSMAGRYPDAAPKPYFQVENQLRFPVSPPAVADKKLPMKTPIVVVQTPSERRLYTLRYLAKKIAESQSEPRMWTDTIADHAINVQLVGSRDDVSVFVSSDSLEPSELLVTHVFWFAWHAMYPEDELLDI
jgi:hypothetical protein